MTWEPGERLQRGSALSGTTILIIVTHAGKRGVHFARNWALNHIESFIVINRNIVECLISEIFTSYGQFMFLIIMAYHIAT